MDTYRDKPEVPQNYICANDDNIIFLDSIIRLEYSFQARQHGLIYHLTDGRHHRFLYEDEAIVRKWIRSIMEMKRAWELYKTRGFIENV